MRVAWGKNKLKFNVDARVVASKGCVEINYLSNVVKCFEVKIRSLRWSV